ncbi:MAG TPA: helix-turn-helix domain-containing protein [Alphaproteobacteria bacterium]|nr:helix-turn-helix domain-containing protein [Alphaproteobacteria bacterium]
MKHEARLTIGGLAAATGCHVETIRYYERIGILPAAERSAGGYRLYDAGRVRMLRFVRRARALGLPLGEVRELLRLGGGGSRSCAAVRRIASRHLVALRARLADLRRMERTLTELAAQCDTGVVPQCPLIEAIQRPG